ncbi:hypothetical protein [Streptomyces sp. PSKA30]|nr:hypothetical protein [Streptomyces sp. PSKA30]MBZ9642352.1 hypothetical protein [Streptomyces sp. PSKA30]
MKIEQEIRTCTVPKVLHGKAHDVQETYTVEPAVPRRTGTPRPSRR